FFLAVVSTVLYTLSLHDALPIFDFEDALLAAERRRRSLGELVHADHDDLARFDLAPAFGVRAHEPRLQLVDGLEGTAHVQHVVEDRKSTRLNSSHSQISYAVFCL